MTLNAIDVTRFPNGVNNSQLDKIFSSMPYLDPTKYHTYDDDFDQFVAGDWTVTETQAGATQALTAGDGGQLSLVNSAADDDVNQIQKLPAAFLPVIGKKLFMLCRFSVSDLIQSDVAVGLINASADATVLANSVDGIFFLKADGANSVSVYSRLDNAAGSVTAVVGALVAGFNDLAIYYNGIDRVYYALNGAVLGYLTVSAATFPNAITTVTASLKNGEAAAKTMIVDRLFVSQER
jgi:hypothetical protein